MKKFGRVMLGIYRGSISGILLMILAKVYDIQPPILFIILLSVIASLSTLAHDDE